MSKVPQRERSTGFLGQVAFVLVASVIAQSLGAAALIAHFEGEIQRTDVARRLAEQLVVADRILEASDGRSAEAVESLSTAHLSFVVAEVPPDASGGDLQEIERMRLSILRWEPQLDPADLVLTQAERGTIGQGGRIAGAFRIDEGFWVQFSTVNPLAGYRLLTLSIASVGLVTLMIGSAVFWFIRSLSKPLARLSDAVETVGDGPPVAFEEAEGPPEVQRLASTLNAMQTRIGELLRNRTLALAAVGHDLRTPLSRARLRLREPDIEAEREPIERDLREMDAMIGSLLSFLNDAETDEAMTKANLASLVETVVADASDSGSAASYEGPARLDACFQPVAMKRVVNNLVENAVKYGGEARVSLTQSGASALLRVEDAGEGVDPAILSSLTEPFFRADAARMRDTEGFGLGLSVSKQIVERHGGRLTLFNAEQGGLCAQVELPLATKVPPASNTSSQS
jgi:signal transduction histidine kinase